MKFRTTQKAIRAQYADIIQISYDNLQHLLSWTSPGAYTDRREGWGSDIYFFDDTAISMGYAPFGNVRPDYTIVHRYDEKARGIYNNRDIPWKIRSEKLENLTNSFIKEVLDHE